MVKYRELVAATELGEITGLMGVNCRHSVSPYIDGVSHNPFEKIDTEENRKAYEMSQRQRELERRIRKTKREVMGLKTGVDNADGATRPGLELEYQKKSALLKKQNEEYNRFCEENGLKRLDERLSIAQWDRKQAAAAARAAMAQNQNVIVDSSLPKKLPLPNTTMPYTINLDMAISKRFPNGFHSVVARGTELVEVEVQAGRGTSTLLRDWRRLTSVYSLPADGWQKKAGKAYGQNYHYVIHWYENSGVIPQEEVKLKGIGKNR